MVYKKTFGFATGFVAVLIFSYALLSYLPGDGDRASVHDPTGKVVQESQADFVDMKSGTFEFEGFSVGKSHVGTFDKWSAKISLSGNKIIGLESTIDTSSVNTGIKGLDNHLRNEDFFEVTSYPEIKFISTQISSQNNQNIMKGHLSFRGITKEISFPVTVTETSIAADFFLDTTPFAMKYTGVNKEVRIAFVISR